MFTKHAVTDGGAAAATIWRGCGCLEGRRAFPLGMGPPGFKFLVAGAPWIWQPPVPATDKGPMVPKGASCRVRPLEGTMHAAVIGASHDAQTSGKLLVPYRGKL